MAVTVRFFAAARSAAGTDTALVKPGAWADVTRQLLADYPGLAAVLPRCSFLMDGVAVHTDHSGVVVPDGTELDVLPPFAGG